MLKIDNSKFSRHHLSLASLANDLMNNDVLIELTMLLILINIK